MLLGHDGIGTNVGAAQLGVMGVMMVMGTTPDAAGTQSPDAKNLHEKFSQLGFGQNRVMLLVMINDKQTQHQQPGHNTGKNPQRERQAGQRSRRGNHQQKRGGKNAPPAFQGIILGVSFGSGMKSSDWIHNYYTSRFSHSDG